MRCEVLEHIEVEARFTSEGGEVRSRRKLRPGDLVRPLSRSGRVYALPDGWLAELDQEYVLDSDGTFIKVWYEAASAEDVARRLRISPAKVMRRVERFLRRGVRLTPH